MKSNIIQNVQHLASKLFNKEVARMHYATDRLTGFTLNQILDLEARFKKEVLIKNQIKWKSNNIKK
jgi:hypothetical protein